MTQALRSFVFNLFFFAGSGAVSLLLLPALLLPARLRIPVVGTVYGGYMSWIERRILGLHLEMRGLEHIPAAGCYILAAKHQSAYETLKLPFLRCLRFPAIIHKKELYALPVWGWYLYGMQQIGIDRGKGAEALRSILAGCRRAAAAGRPIIIFPQGTRVAVGAAAEYKVGTAKIYRDLGVPLVPMALNSGLFWRKNAFLKKPGMAVFEFLPPIPPGRPPLQMMEELERAIEAATDRLVQEARAA